ncbi:serine/threonine-protein kinase tbk1-like [Plakobranchus ocellatus]|uniref:Serine/threonine-protein kinase tbk1-like n=1 Tax=Plakobranchus ocellatus TaxID=259542 RepID=A0AAV3YN07_9GAST|nr:serine/threonine-protein kinase tbk1-like [Plakobranchus ocellatus]
MATDLLLQFVKQKAISEASNLYILEFQRRSRQKDRADLMIGEAARSYLSEQKEVLPNTAVKFFEVVRAFYSSSLSYIFEKLPLNDQLLRHAKVLNVEKRKSQFFQSVCFLAERFLCLKPDMEKAEIQFAKYQMAALEGIATERVDKVWAAISKLQDFSIGTPKQKYAELAQFMMAICCLPQGNADSERIFSLVRKNETEQWALMSWKLLSGIITIKCDLISKSECCFQQTVSSSVLDKLLVTPFLASLLENDPNKVLSFEEFFAQVDDITHRIPYDVFCPSTFSLLRVYTKPRDDMSLLRQLITDQTDILGGTQLLMHDGKVLKEESRVSVASLLTQVSAENPIIVFNRLPEYKMFRKPTYGSFLELPPETSSDDYPLCKRNFAVLLSVKNCVKSLMQKNNLLTKAVKMYSSYVNQKSSRLHLSVSHVKHSCSESKLWREQLFAFLDIQVNLFKSLATSNLRPTNIDITGRINVLETLQQTGQRECQQLNATLQSKLEQALSLLQNIQSGQAMDLEWKPGIGCVPQDRCIEKMEVMLQKLQKILSSFREDRNKRQLNNNDEQIHRFDKNKMKEICVTAQTLVEDDCTTKSAQLFKAFKQAYSRAVQIHDSGERLEGLVKDILHMQERLVEKLRVCGRQCIQQSESCMQALGQSTSKPTNGDGPGKKEAWPENRLEGQQLNTNGTSRQMRLDLVLDRLQTTRTSLEELTALLNENTSIMERFHMLQNQDGSEDLKSWEYVPIPTPKQ